MLCSSTKAIVRKTIMNISSITSGPRGSRARPLRIFGFSSWRITRNSCHDFRPNMWKRVASGCFHGKLCGRFARTTARVHAGEPPSPAKHNTVFPLVFAQESSIFFTFLWIMCSKMQSIRISSFPIAIRLIQIYNLICETMANMYFFTWSLTPADRFHTKSNKTCHCLSLHTSQ